MIIMKKTADLNFSERMAEVAEILGCKKSDGEIDQTKLGKIFEVSQAATYKWLNGLSRPSSSNLEDIVNKANVSHEWLTTGRGDKQIKKMQIKNTI